MKLLTVSIAAYNVEQYLECAISSCTKLNDDRLEVIVVNDGSTDSSSDIAHKAQEHYPDIVRVIDQKNHGYGSTINASLQAATGKYFRFLDGDDVFDEQGLKSLVNSLETAHAQIIITPYIRFFESGAPEKIIDNAVNTAGGSIRTEALSIDTPIAAHSLTYQTELLRNSNFTMPERGFFTDIYYAYTPWLTAESAFISHTPLYRYRIGREGQSVSLSGIKKHYRDMRKSFERLYSVYDQHDKKNPYFFKCLTVEGAHVYAFYCTANAGRQAKQDLIEFDKSLTNAAPELSQAIEKSSKLVKLLRHTKFVAYPLACSIKEGRAKKAEAAQSR